MKQTLTNILVTYSYPITIYCENKSAISISKNQAQARGMCRGRRQPTPHPLESLRHMGPRSTKSNGLMLPPSIKHLTFLTPLHLFSVGTTMKLQALESALEQK